MDLKEKREFVAGFLRRCVDYASESISRKRERGVGEEEISKWTAYKEFTEHAAIEVSSGDLDSWLEDE